MVGTLAVAIPKNMAAAATLAAWMSHILRFAPFVAKFSKHFGCSRLLVLLCRSLVKSYVVVFQIKMNCPMPSLMHFTLKREFLVVVNPRHA